MQGGVKELFLSVVLFNWFDDGAHDSQVTGIPLGANQGTLAPL